MLHKQTGWKIAPCSEGDGLRERQLQLFYIFRSFIEYMDYCLDTLCGPNRTWSVMVRQYSAASASHHNPLKKGMYLMAQSPLQGHPWPPNHSDPDPEVQNPAAVADAANIAGWAQTISNDSSTQFDTKKSRSLAIIFPVTFHERVCFKRKKNSQHLYHLTLLHQVVSDPSLSARLVMLIWGTDKGIADV